MSETQPTRPSPTPKTVKDVAEIADKLKEEICCLIYQYDFPPQRCEDFERLKHKSLERYHNIPMTHWIVKALYSLFTESTAELQRERQEAFKLYTDIKLMLDNEIMRNDQLRAQLDELTKLPMPLPSDPTTPFYKETMEQAKQLREMATRTGDIQADRLERISRKLNYMNDAFTCTANFVPMQLEVHELKKQIVELRRQMDKPIQ